MGPQPKTSRVPMTSMDYIISPFHIESFLLIVSPPSNQLYLPVSLNTEDISHHEPSHVPNQNIPTSSRPEHPNPLFHNIYIRSDNLCIKFFELGTLCPSYQLKKELSCAKLTLISSKTIAWFYIVWTYRAMSSLIVQVLKWHWLHCFICRHGLDIMS